MKNDCKPCILVIVPHQDDELNLIGPIIPNLRQIGFEVDVVFTTNGDWQSNSLKRFNESQKVKKLLGINKTIYLGYPDTGSDLDQYDIYSNSKSTYTESRIVYTKGPSNVQEYCYIKHNKHNLVTRENILSDLYEIIMDTKPFAVFCVDYDSHPDHKLTSLLVDQAMVKIKDKINPLPLYLKGFSYLGNWLGDNDYFDFIPKPTKNTLNGHEVLPIPYKWNDRTTIPVNPRFYRTFYWHSKLYKAYRCYKSQKADQYFFRCLNTDKIFWFRDLSNICINSEINATSGDVSFLNDGKLIDSCNLRYGLSHELPMSWHPIDNDPKKTSTIKLNHYVLELFGYIYFTEQLFEKTIILLHYKSKTEIINATSYVTSFNIKSDTPFDEIELSFEKSSNKKLYVNEIELFDEHKQKERLNQFLSLFEKYVPKKRRHISTFIACSIRKISTNFKHLQELISRIISNRKNKTNVVKEFSQHFSMFKKGVYLINCKNNFIYNISEYKTYLFESRNTYRGQEERKRKNNFFKKFFLFFYNYRLCVLWKQKQNGNCTLGILTSKLDTIKLFDYKNNKVFSFYKDKNKLLTLSKNKNLLSQIGFLTIDSTIKNSILCEKYIHKQNYDYEFGLISFLSWHNKSIKHDKISTLSKDNINIKATKDFLIDYNLFGLIDLLHNFVKENNYKICFAHGDFHPMNYVFDGEKFFVLDYENVSKHIFFFDPLFYISQCLLFYNNTNLIKSFFNGKYDFYFDKYFSKYGSKFNKEYKSLYIALTIIDWYNYKSSSTLFYVISKLLSYSKQPHIK